MKIFMQQRSSYWLMTYLGKTALTTFLALSTTAAESRGTVLVKQNEKRQKLSFVPSYGV